MQEKRRPSVLQELNEKEELINSLLDSSYDGIFVLDEDANIVKVSRAMERITGLIPERLIGKNMQDLIRKGVMHKNSVSPQVFKTRKRMSTLLKFPDKVILSTANPCFGSNGEVKYVICNVRSITELDALRCELEQLDELERLRVSKFYKSKLLASLKKHGIEEFLFQSDSITKTIELILSLTEFDLKYLISGETGTGKGLTAKIIHSAGKRRNAPFVEVNCSAIPKDLLESELFGYREGAFSGASREGKVGLLEAADMGTVFLDEIGSMPLETQAKILKFLDDRQIKRLGSSESIHLDVQIISATNRDLIKEVEQGTFRRDLFFRLNEIAVEIPPLRERPDDVAFMLEYFWEKYTREFNRRIILHKSALDYLRHYHYPGNVRELKNIVKRLILKSRNTVVELIDLTAEISTIDAGPRAPSAAQPGPNEDRGLKDAVSHYERELIKDAYEQHGSTYSAARALKMNQSTFYRKAKKYGLLA